MAKLDPRAHHFVSDGDTFHHPICNDCVWYLTDATCQAFPDGILDIVLTGENNHSQKLPGQIGDFVFKKKEGA
ncbi:MAG: hypothetical protein FVQ80_06955 [Planctomycetes bacterium]|nr:hypothetical protein [Planctomycetota bacterium]